MILLVYYAKELGFFSKNKKIKMFFLSILKYKLIKRPIFKLILLNIHSLEKEAKVKVSWMKIIKSLDSSTMSNKRFINRN